MKECDNSTRKIHISSTLLFFLRKLVFMIYIPNTLSAS